MDPEEARRRFCTSPVARLATVRPDGGPHLVPVVFATEDHTIFMAIDTKPKRTRRLQRLANLRTEPRCALLVDAYDSDWSQLWWARADGTASIVDEPPSSHPGLALLAASHPPYAETAPPGPLIVVTVSRWSGWAASS